MFGKRDWMQRQAIPDADQVDNWLRTLKMHWKSHPLYCVSLALLFALGAPSLETETHVLSPSESRLRVRMATVFYESEPLIPAIHTRDFALTGDQDGTRLARGLDKSGKPWRLVLPPATRGAWASDRGGARTYFFAGYTGGAGMAPDTWIVAISFDEQARPIPFYTTTYGAPYDNRGIKDLIDLDADGPVLLQQDWIETNWARDTRSGYFITTAYHRRGDYWYRTDGQHGSNTLPVFEKWSLLPNSQPQRVASSSDLARLVSDYGNDPQSGTEARIVGFDDRGIHTEHLGCSLQSISVIVYDSEAARQIEVVAYPNDQDKLLQRIARRRSLVALTGMRRWPQSACDATILWAGIEGR